MSFKGAQYVWKDRKRYLGLPISFTRYALSEDRLFFSIGFFSISDEEILLYRIRDISLKRTLWQRIFGVGTISIVSSDKTAPTSVLKNIKHPFETKELLHSLVEESKLKRRVRINELMDSPSAEELDDGFDEDDL